MRGKSGRGNCVCAFFYWLRCGGHLWGQHQGSLDHDRGRGIHFSGGEFRQRSGGAEASNDALVGDVGPVGHVAGDRGWLHAEDMALLAITDVERGDAHDCQEDFTVAVKDLWMCVCGWEQT